MPGSVVLCCLHFLLLSILELHEVKVRWLTQNVHASLNAVVIGTFWSMLYKAEKFDFYIDFVL